MRQRFLCLLGLPVLLVSATFVQAQDAAEIEQDHGVASAFVTPHTAWAKPYALGTTRVLFFCRGEGVDPREAIELRERFDIDLQMVFWTRVIDSTEEGWHGGERGIQRMARLLTEKWDAFVFLAPQAAGVRSVSLDALPLEQQLAVLQAVSQGAGLVMVGNDDPRVLKDKNRLQELPSFLRDITGANAFTVLQGRGIRLPARPVIDYRPGWEAAYDEWAMRFGKAILWAAGKEPKLGLTLQPQAEQLARSALPGTAATLQWQGATAAAGATLVLRREDGAMTTLPSLSLSAPTGSVALQMPRVQAGNYYLDVVARQGDKVAGLGSLPLTVVNERRVASLTLAQDWAEIGSSLTGKVALAGPATGGESLVISLLDRRDREIARQTAAADATEQAFHFEVQPWFPMLLEVRATLVDGRGEVASAWRLARVVKRHRGQFNFNMWGPPSGNLAPWAAQALAKSGVTLLLDSGGYSRADTTPQPYYAAAEIAWVPYTTHIGTACQPACWADDAKIQEYVDSIVAKNIPTRRHGVFVYSLGDEIVVRGSCLQPSCLAAYRGYLQEQYKDIAALNASWGSTYASFDAVQLSQADDNEEAAALRDGNFPRWFDRQAYQSYNFCKLCERFGQAFRRIDPESRCGFEGAGSFDSADDLDGFVRSNGFWSPYPGTADEVLRSIAPRDFPRANWMGYTKDADTLLEKYWRMVTRGCDGVWWWTWSAMGRFRGWLAPTLDPNPAVQEILRDTQIVRDGLGDLLLHSEMQTDGIGILYSQPSGYAAKVQVSPTYGSYEGNHAACHSALRDLGLNFRYFTDRQMRLGEVDLSQFKVIILPLTQAMGAQEAEMLRTFVRQGGTLVADVRPAIYDGHVKPLAAGQLDDVFGIRRTGFPEAHTGAGVIQGPVVGRTASPPMELADIRCDAGVQTAGATVAGAAGQAPLLLTNEFGKGRAVLLNLAAFSLTSYRAPTWNTTGGAESASEPAARLWQRVLDAGHVAAALDLRDAKGARLRNIEVTRWQNGPVQIVSVFRHAGSPEPAVLRLPEAQYVYDLKARKGLGKQQTVSLTLTPYRAQFYAFSPQPLKPAALEATPTVAPGGVGELTLTAALATGQQAVKIEVKLPDGRLSDWHDAVVVVDGRGAKVAVPVAFNDPPGRWTVSATELYTGKTTTARFRVK
jgi:hypothetical protein